MSKNINVRPAGLVCKSIAVDSSLAPSKIHGSNILGAIRKGKS